LETSTLKALHNIGQEHHIESDKTTEKAMLNTVPGGFDAIALQEN